MRTLTPPNQRDSDAVDARQEIDLRIGAAFTRLLSLRYQRKLEGIENMISFGPCQFPTLGFVVERFIRVQNFEEEPFWSIRCDHRVPAQQLSASFTWARGSLFDRDVAQALFDVVMSNPVARVTHVSKNVRRKWYALNLQNTKMLIACLCCACCFFACLFEGDPCR